MNEIRRCRSVVRIERGRHSSDQTFTTILLFCWKSVSSLVSTIGTVFWLSQDLIVFWVQFKLSLKELTKGSNALMPASKRSRNINTKVFYRKSDQINGLSNITMMSTGLVSLSCDNLRQLLDLLSDSKSSNILILDCRPFLIHNESHIVKSINIHCPPILRSVLFQW
jgi:hypothetical protein